MGEYDDMFYDPPTPRKQVRLESEIEWLRAENARLRAALEKIAELDGRPEKRLNPAFIEIIDIARAALTGRVE